MVTEKSASLLPQMQRAFHDCFVFFGISGMLEELISNARNPDIKGALRRCLAEVQEEQRRRPMEFRGILPEVAQQSTLQGRVQKSRDVTKYFDSKKEERSDMSTEERVSGFVERYWPDKGYGFIKIEGRSRDLFVHYTALQSAGLEELERGQAVTFVIGPGQKGDEARDVALDI